MKKLLTMIGIAAIALGANAASVKWTANGIAPTSGSGLAGDDYYAYGLLASDSSGNNKTISVADAWALLQAGTDLYDDNAASNYDLGGASLTAGAANGDPYDGGWAAGDTIQGYLLIVDNSDISAITKYMVTDVMTLNIENAGATYSFNFGTLSSATWTDFATAPGGSSSDVPEPTSGVLMLLGVAGLALKRKRA